MCYVCVLSKEGGGGEMKRGGVGVDGVEWGQVPDGLYWSVIFEIGFEVMEGGR